MANLHILMVEDSDSDAQLAGRALHKADISFSSTRVDTEATLRTQLREHPPDLSPTITCPVLVGSLLSCLGQKILATLSKRTGSEASGLAVA